jgi:hypothetical protein
VFNFESNAPFLLNCDLREIIEIGEEKMKRFLAFSSIGVFLPLFIVSGALAQTRVKSVQPDAEVKIVKKDGNVFEGRIVKVAKTRFMINTLQGPKVYKYLKEIKKIVDTGKTDTGGGISYRPVHDT